jgi:hypothetical protein
LPTFFYYSFVFIVTKNSKVGRALFSKLYLPPIVGAREAQDFFLKCSAVYSFHPHPCVRVISPLY